jgi:hypothetical protein
MAERKGFEPLRRFPAYTLSRRAPSTTRPSLRMQAGLGPGSAVLAGLNGRGGRAPVASGRNIPIGEPTARAQLTDARGVCALRPYGARGGRVGLHRPGGPWQDWPAAGGLPGGGGAGLTR